MNLPKIVSHDEWLAARKGLLAKEKDFTRARDRLNAERRRLPMVRIERSTSSWKEPPGRSWLPASGWWWRRHDEYEQEINGSRSSCPG
jgi:hypothetical protein